MLFLSPAMKGGIGEEWSEGDLLGRFRRGSTGYHTGDSCLWADAWSQADQNSAIYCEWVARTKGVPGWMADGDPGNAPALFHSVYRGCSFLPGQPKTEVDDRAANLGGNPLRRSRVGIHAVRGHSILAHAAWAAHWPKPADGSDWTYILRGITDCACGKEMGRRQVAVDGGLWSR